MTSNLSRLPLELITSIVQYLPTNEVFRLRHIIPEFRSDVIREQALANGQTHRAADSARPRWRPGCENLDEREALFKQHHQGYPCRRVVESRSLNLRNDRSRYDDFWTTCHGSMIASELEPFKLRDPYKESSCIIAVYDLVTNSATVIEFVITTSLALTAKLLVFRNNQEIFVVPREKLRPGRMSETEIREDPEIWRKICADELPTWRSIIWSAAYENHVAYITDKVRWNDGGKQLYIYDESKHTSSEVPNLFTHIVSSQTPQEAGDAIHHLVFDEEILWHVCATQQQICSPNEQRFVEITFQKFSLDGQLLHQWQHRFRLSEPSEPFIDLVSSHTGRGSWLLTLQHGKRYLNWIVDFSACSISPFKDGACTIWKDKVYRLCEADNRKIDVLRLSDLRELGRLSLNMLSMRCHTLTVNDSFMIIWGQCFDDENSIDYHGWIAFTFDEKVAMNGQPVLMTASMDKRMFWQPLDPERPYTDPFERYESNDEGFDAATEYSRLLERDVANK